MALIYSSHGNHIVLRIGQINIAHYADHGSAFRTPSMPKTAFSRLAARPWKAIFCSLLRTLASKLRASSLVISMSARMHSPVVVMVVVDVFQRLCLELGFGQINGPCQWERSIGSFHSLHEWHCITSRISFRLDFALRLSSLQNSAQALAGAPPRGASLKLCTSQRCKPPVQRT